MHNRISREELFINTAILVAQRATCGRAKVGAVIVKNNRVVSTGYNGPPPNPIETNHCSENTCNLTLSCTSAIHAEANAIYSAARLGISLEGTDLYITHCPCIKCSEAIIQSGIKKVFYLTEYRTAHDSIAMLNRSGILVEKLHNLRIIINETY